MIFVMVLVFGTYLNPNLITSMEDLKLSEKCVVQFVGKDRAFFPNKTCEEVRNEIAKQMEKL